MPQTVENLTPHILYCQLSDVLTINIIVNDEKILSN